MKSAMKAFWIKHPIAHVILTYTILIPLYVVASVVSVIEEALKAGKDEGVERFNDLRGALKRYSQLKRKNRKQN